MLLMTAAIASLSASSVRADDDDWDDYRRKSERKLRDLERDHFERRRDLAEDLREDDVSPREYYRRQERIEREYQEDLRDYQRWQRERIDDLDRRGYRQLERHYDTFGYGPYVDSHAYPRHYRHDSGYRAHRGGGFHINVGRFSFYIDP